MNLYVEGGGDSKSLRTDCRKGFSAFVTKSGLKNRPRIVACGSRRDAFESFCTAINSGKEAMLLVDSEESTSEIHQTERTRPWLHLKQRVGDDWDKPVGCDDNDCHLMVQVMESWFLADRETLAKFFGNGFKQDKLPANSRNIETVPKHEVYDALKEATANCKTKGSYSKGKHSFIILEKIDPAKIFAASPWAQRFVDELKKKMDG